MDTDKQENASDSGMHSLAFSTALCAGEDPRCLQLQFYAATPTEVPDVGKMEPFPSKKK